MPDCDWLEVIGPPLPPAPKPHIALWMHDDDYLEQYLINAQAWREEMQRKHPGFYR